MSIPTTRPQPSPPLVSVVVPTYQRCELLEILLRALAIQSMPAEQYEVIVIADGSTDRTCEMLASHEAAYALRWRWQPNAGRAAACNAGIALARGDLVVLLDDDMEPVPICLQAHASAHPAGTRRAVIGAVPIVTSATSPLAAYVARKFNYHCQTLASRGRPLGLRDFYSGNLSVSRDVLVDIGGFDEDFTTYGHEDLELSCRLRSAGVELAFSTAATAYQRYVKDFAAFARDNVDKGQTAVLLLSKHPDTVNELKLAAITRELTLRRLALQGTVALTRCWPAVFQAIVQLMSTVERVTPVGLDRAYALAADYCYLLGAATASRDRRSAHSAES